MIPFRPVVEPIHPGAFLTEDPAVSSMQGRLSDIPWMTGITSEEGALVVPGISRLCARFHAGRRNNNRFLQARIFLSRIVRTEQRRIDQEAGQRLLRYRSGNAVVRRNVRDRRREKKRGLPDSRILLRPGPDRQFHAVKSGRREYLRGLEFRITTTFSTGRSLPGSLTRAEFHVSRDKDRRLDRDSGKTPAWKEPRPSFEST